MSVGVDAHIDPAMCNHKIAHAIGETVKRSVGADDPVRPRGNYGFAATFHENGRASCRADRVVRPYGCVRIHIGAFNLAALYRAGGGEPRPYVTTKIAKYAKPRPFCLEGAGSHFIQFPDVGS